MIEDYFTPGDDLCDGLLEGAHLPWDPLRRLKAFLQEQLDRLGPRVPEGLDGSIHIKGLVHIEDGALIEEGTYIAGPTLICAGAEVRFGAYIRGDVLLGAGAVVGHDSEVKHSALFPRAKAAHFAYVGDSILGRDVNLGAGTKLANVRVDLGKSNLKIGLKGQLHDTGLRKFGAILGDGSSLGCNSVTNPGTLVGRGCLSYPLANLSGVYQPNSIIKVRQEKTVVARRK